MSSENGKMTGIVPHGLLLGWQDQAKGFPQPIWNTGEGHLITIAPTGGGKGVSCVIPALLSWRGPVIVIDPKGENTLVTAERRRALGQKVVVLDPFRLTGPDTDRLNPFDLIVPGSRTEDDDAALLTSLLLQGLSVKSDPFWDERAAALISEAIGHVLGLKPEHRHLGQLRSLVEDEAAGMGDYMVARSAPPSFGKGARFGFDRTRASVLATACSHVSFIRDGAVEHVLSASTLSLDDIRMGAPLSIFIVLPPERLATDKKLLRLWLGVMMAVIARRRRAPAMPTLFLVDEAAQLGELEELRTAITLLRGYGVKVWTFWQDLAQLMNTYPRDWQSLINNCAVQQVFSPMSPQAQAHIRDYYGPLMERPYRALKAREQLLSRPGEPLAITRRPDYRTDAIFRGLWQENPFYRRAEEERG